MEAIIYFILIYISYMLFLGIIITFLKITSNGLNFNTGSLFAYLLFPYAGLGMDDYNKKLDKDINHPLPERYYIWKRTIPVHLGFLAYGFFVGIMFFFEANSHPISHTSRPAQNYGDLVIETTQTAAEIGYSSFVLLGSAVAFLFYLVILLVFVFGFNSYARLKMRNIRWEYLEMSEQGGGENERESNDGLLDDL